MKAPDIRLDALRGSAPRLPYNARSLAALENNPRCTLRAVLDASGSDKAKIADRAGYSTHYGQSIFAITRGNSFEAMVKAHGGAELLRVLRETLHLEPSEVAHADLNDVSGDPTPSVRHTRTCQRLVAVARGQEQGTLFDHPMLMLTVGGHKVYLEPDLVAFRVRGKFHVVEVKSFPIIDRQANPALVRSATTQAAAYIIALRTMLAEHGIGPGAVSDTVVLVAPKNFSNRPTGERIDARKQVRNLARQLQRLDKISDIVDKLPEDLTFDLVDGDGRPRSTEELLDALTAVESNYRPDCLNHCEMAFFCRSRARASMSVDVLGPVVREQLGGIDTATMALGLARGELTPTADQAETAAALRHAARLRAELTETAAGGAR
ncbi:hypothetical protein B7C42_06890 [Nocardia cerradoensis]|uniref:Secreted protein n=1 Tax=Nocardia cerradoensis TaxID=85688 RepID=A0A231GWX0_9NOCA|nr:hypothetical protein [Nocardia cerradoensis]OXR41120.1 hypothetical protein B7C42_06890 [Nocardia cerradoensis]